MTNKEFSDNFDTLVNSFGVAPYIVLDEYEKSLYLTNAQEALVVDYYSGTNIRGLSFEETEELRVYLKSLIKTTTIYTPHEEDNIDRLVTTSTIFKLPEDLLFITYESVRFEDSNKCINNREAIIVPTTQDEFYRISKNPFKRASNNRVLRLDSSSDTVELVSQYKIGEYKLRYLKTPNPIVLTDLVDTSINGIAKESICELNPVLHKEILDRAVQLALKSKTQLAGK